MVRLLDAHHLHALLDGDTGVARGAEELRARGALAQAPAQGVLAPAAADDEDVDRVRRGGDDGATRRRRVDDENASALGGLQASAERSDAGRGTRAPRDGDARERRNRGLAEGSERHLFTGRSRERCAR